MAWRFTREALLARRRFQVNDPLPPWLSDGAMVRYINARWPGLLCDDTSGSPPPPPGHEDPDRVKQEQLAASWAEWETMRERLARFEEPAPEEDP